MANMCNNRVVFEGQPEVIEQVQQLFQTLKEKELQTEKGLLPDFVTDENGGYFFDIFQEDTTDIIEYETKWSPNIEVIRKVAEHFGIQSRHEYSEPSSSIYGKAIFADGTLTDICLDNQDFEQFRLDEETDNYHFEGEQYKSNCEILETLLQRKIENL